MKNILILSTVLIAFSAAPILADHHGGGEDKGKRFEQKDTNGDGVISKAEFLNAHEAKFQKIDADGDGSISKDEAKAHRKHAREKFKERREDRRDGKRGAAEE